MSVWVFLCTIMKQYSEASCHRVELFDVFSLKEILVYLAVSKSWNSTGISSVILINQVKWNIKIPCYEINFNFNEILFEFSLLDLILDTDEYWKKIQKWKNTDRCGRFLKTNSWSSRGQHIPWNGQNCTWVRHGTNTISTLSFIMNQGGNKG